MTRICIVMHLCPACYPAWKLLYAEAGSGLALDRSLRPAVMSGGAVRIDLNYDECDGEDEQQRQEAELERACSAHSASSSEEPRS